MRRAGKIAAGSVLALALALALAQLVLPQIAASRISDRLGRYGRVEHVGVDAWPAIKLLWGEADAVRVKARTLKLAPATTASLLRDARGADRLDASATTVFEGRLRLDDVRLRKRGAALSAVGFAAARSVKGALPAGVDVRLVQSRAGAVEVRATGGLFGMRVPVDALAEAAAGRLLVRAVGPPGERLSITLFADPRIYVESLAASPVESGAGGPGYRLTALARER